MLSQEYLDILYDLNNEDSTKDLMKFNQIALKLEDLKEIEKEAELFKTLNKIDEDYIYHINKDSFEWTTEAAVLLKNFFADLIDKKTPLYLEFANTDFLNSSLSCVKTKLFCEVKRGKIGGDAIYDEALRALSNMLQFFLHNHIKKALVFKPKLNTKSMHFYDPCYREKVRKMNQADPEICSRFFTEDFDIKSLMFYCLSRYFPNVSWRWLGGGHFAHHMTLKVILEMFEYGLWKLEDLENLLEKVYICSEILYNLEKNIQKDCVGGRFGSAAVKKWQKISTKCREIIASIYLHIIIMYYDNDVMLCLPQFGISVGSYLNYEPLYDPKTKANPDQLFKLKNFKKKRFYIYLGLSLVTYLQKNVKFNNAESENYSSKLTNLSDLLFSLVNQTKNSFYYTSLNNLLPASLPFYLLAFNSSIYQDAAKFLQEFKHANYLVQTANIESQSVDVPDFYNIVKDLLLKLKNFFLKLDQDKELITAYQLAFLIHNIPQYILSFMHFISIFEYKEDQKKAIMREGILVLLELAQSNPQVATSLFSGYNYYHIRQLMKKDIKSSIYLVAKIFGQASAFHIIENNENILNNLIEDFKPILAKVVKEFTEWIKDRNANMSCDNLVCLIILNKLLKPLITRTTLKNFRFELTISRLLSEQSFNILVLYAENKVECSEGEMQNSESFHKLEHIMKVLHDWETTEIVDKEAIIFEGINSTLSTFRASISRLITPQIFDKFYPGFKNEIAMDKFTYLLHTPTGLRIFGSIMRLFSCFMIFRQNSVINLSEITNPDLKAEKEEYLTPSQVGPWISNQLVGLSRPVIKKIETEGVNVHFQAFLMKSYIPLIFKYFSGFFTHLSDEKFVDLKVENRNKLIKNLKKFHRIGSIIENYFANNYGMKNVDSCRQEFIKQFIDIQATKNVMFCYPKSFHDVVDETRDMGCSLLIQLCRLYLWDECRVKHITSYVRYSFTSFEDKLKETLTSRIENHMTFASSNANKDDSKRIVWKKNHQSVAEYDEMQTEGNALAEKTFNVLKYFDFEIFSQKDYDVFTYKRIETVGFKQRNSYSFSANEKEEIKGNIKYAAKVVYYLKTRFAYINDYFIKRPHMNQILQVFKLEDVMKNNVEYYIDTFIFKIMEMDFTFEKISHNYLATNSYLYLLLTMDKLIRTSKNYRSAFYKRISSSNQQVIHKLWHIHKILSNFLVYKTFLDDAWNEIYVWYYLISNFIQNLCEDNYADFKNWFYTEKTKTNNQVSLIEDYFEILEKAIQFNELNNKDKKNLRINDRPELIPIYERLMVGFTEFINGGQTLGQSIVFEKRIDIWVGITLRIVDDIDSRFYDLKSAVIIYINALLEGEDPKTVNFIASNFSVTGVFNLMTSLIKKLFVRQYLIKKERKKKFWNKNDIKMISNIGKEEEQKIKKIEFSLLLDYYKKYDETFSDHVLINTVVDLYSFMKTMGDIVVRYGNFLKELNTIKSQVFQKKQKFRNETYDLESITIWHFITTIIIELEIRFKDKFSKEKHPKLILHHFKKLPICFFLTNTVKEDFYAKCNIDTLDFKHEEFFDKTKDHIIIMRDLRDIFIRSKILFYTSTDDAFTIFMQVLYLIGIVINLLLLFLYNKSKKMFLGLDPQLYDESLSILVIVNAAFSLVLLVYWFLMKYPTVRRIKWEAYYTTRSRKKKPSLFHRVQINIYKSIIRMKVPRSFFLHSLFCLLGRFVNPFFYTLLLLLVVDLSMLAHSVIISFVKNYDKLGYTLLMILVIINFFAYLAADFFEYTFIDEAKQDNICSTYFSCLMNSLDIGMRAGGGIADKMVLNGSTDSTFFAGRFFFDIFFFILINIILLGIFFGIIVDSFKAYRDQIEKRSKDQKSICFTCGLTKDLLEKSGIDFDNHLEYHDIWNYFFYTIYLKWKPSNSYDGVDIYIDENIESNNRAAWMPIKTTMQFEKHRKDADENL